MAAKCLRVCLRMSLIMVPYVYGALTGLMETMWTYNLAFCGRNEINQFYCADPPLIKLACSITKNCPCLLWLVLTSLVLSSSSSFLPSTFFLPRWGFVPQKAGAKLSLPVAPIWQLSPSSTQLFSSCILDPLQRSPCRRGKWWLCFTPQWSPCWSPWSTVWGTRMWKKLWWKNCSVGNCFLLINEFSANVLKTFYFL